MNQKQLVQAVMRGDFRMFFRRAFAQLLPGTTYSSNWHLDAICHQVDRLVLGETHRLLVTLPPRHLKSTLVSAALPAYLLGLFPNLRIVAASYSQDLSRQFSLQTRQIMSAPWYQELFPSTVLMKGNNTQDEFHTTANGYRMATSVGGGLTGFGGDLLIIDDAMKADDAMSETKRQSVLDWYQQTAATRLNDPKNGMIVVVQQRLHEQDLAGMLIAAGGWTHLNLPAIAEEPQSIDLGHGRWHHRKLGEPLHASRLPIETLDQIRREIGRAAFAAQYQQEPAAAGAGILRWDDFEFFDGPLRSKPGDYRVQTWDFGYSVKDLSDYTVCLTWVVRCEKLFLIDMYRTKCDGSTLIGLIPQMAARFKVDTVVLEANGAGAVIVSQLIAQNRRLYRWNNHAVAKDVRLLKAAPYVEMGRVHLNAQMTDFNVFRRELTGFPNSRHDDIVDAFSLFFVLLHGSNLPAALREARRLYETEPV